MKKSFCFIFIVINCFLYGQNEIKGFDERYFLGDQIKTIEGKYITLLPKNESEQEFGYSNFYSDYDLITIYKKAASYNSSNYADLAGKKFLLKEVKPLDISNDNYILILNDEENNYAYFKYNSKNPTLFPFSTDKIVSEKPIELHDYCSKIDVIKDKFTNTITKRSPVGEPVCFVKDGSFYLRLKTYGSTPVIDGTGVIILLDNGKKIVKNSKIDVEVDQYSGKYEYTAFIRLTKVDIDLLTKFAIDDFKLYIFENVRKLDGLAYKEYIKCIVK